MSDEQNVELSDVRAEIDSLIERVVTLRVKENSLIARQIPKCSETPLRWNDAIRTISWFGGLCKLSPKEYLFVKTLWNGKDHYAEWSVIEEIVWAERFQKNSSATFLSKNTVKVFLSRLQAKLEKLHFPYTIVPIAGTNNHGTSGWCLIITENYKKT